jgi:hypothetical protein
LFDCPYEEQIYWVEIDAHLQLVELITVRMVQHNSY